MGAVEREDSTHVPSARLLASERPESVVRSRRERAPAWRMTRRLTSPALIGRQREVDRILTALGDISSGSRCLAIIGEAGIGKSRLVREATTQAKGRGARAAIGACVDLESGGVPFGPIREAFAQLRIDADGFSLIAPDDVAPDRERRQRLFRDALGQLEGATRDGPVLVAIEDLQWSDRSTRDLLAHLMGQPTVGALFLLSVRSEHAPISAEVGSFLAELEQRGVAERIDLEPLTSDEVVAQCRAILRRRPEAELLDPIQRRAEGNPFFVEELLAVAIAGRGGVLPPTVTEAVLARVAELGGETEGLLRLAAVGGRRVPHRLLERSSGLAAPGLESVLRPAIRRGLVTAETGATDDAYAFRHALVQEALYRDLLPSERARLHARYAASLADDPSLLGDPVLRSVEIAHHRERAHDLAGARSAWIDAGDAAYRMLAFPEADAHFARALAIPVPHQDVAAEADLLERASQAARAGGDPQRAVTILREAIAALGSRDLPRRVYLWQQLSSSLWEAGEIVEAEKASEECVRLAKPLPASAAKARAATSLASVDLVLGFIEAARSRSAAACQIARESGSQTELAFALNVHGLAHAALGDGEAGVADLRAAWETAREVNSIELRASTALHYLDVVDLAQGAVVALTLGHELLADARRRSTADHVFHLLATMGGLQVRLGRWDAARESFEEAASGLFTQPSVALLATERTVLAASRGRFREARELAAQAADLIGDTHELPYSLAIARATATLALCENDPASARAAVERGLASALPGTRNPVHVPPVLLLGLQALADLVEASRSRRTAKASGTVASLRRSAARFGEQLFDLVSENEANPDRRWLRTLAEAELARAQGRDTPELWARVIDRASAAQLVPARGYALLRHAAVLLRDSRWRADAEGLLADAHAIAVRLGAVPLRKRIDLLARRARIHIPSLTDDRGVPATGTVDELSPRELEVLGLVARGFSNRQIAESLFITEKTAGAHVSSILGKLQVANRGEAAVTALKSGIIGS